jgi:DnaA family protein
MSQQQATLPFNQQATQNFQHFEGNQAVVETLKNIQSLPQFVYIWGNSFSGKTHLLSAMSAFLSEADAVCFAVDAVQLTQVDLTQVLPEGLNFLLLDGVQVLAGVADAEVALFNLFNHCKARGTGLIVSASIHNKSNKWQLPDLISRLNSGLSLRLETLQGSAALTCISRQFAVNGIPLERAVIQYLQTHHSSDYAELYRLFLQVSAESLKLKRKVTVPLLKQIMQQQANQNMAENTEL